MKFCEKLWWKLCIIVAVLIALPYLIIAYTSYQFIVPLETAPNAHTAIVLGAGIKKDGTLSQIFKDRIDMGLALYEQGTVETILISGDNSTETYNEVNPAREYLLSQGVPSEVIFLDHAGFDTYSSMYRAKNIFLVESAIVVTQPFHMSRAIFLAKALGITTYGVGAQQHPVAFKNYIREALADIKAVANVITKRSPKYLGEKIPITGDNSESI